MLHYHCICSTICSTIPLAHWLRKKITAEFSKIIPLRGGVRKSCNRGGIDGRNGQREILKLNMFSWHTTGLWKHRRFTCLSQWYRQTKMSQLKQMLLLCGLSDTVLPVHTAEPGRWSVTHPSTLLICSVALYVCVWLSGGLSAVSQEDPEEKNSFLLSLKSGASVEESNYPLSLIRVVQNFV